MRTHESSLRIRIASRRAWAAIAAAILVGCAGARAVEAPTTPATTSVPGWLQPADACPASVIAAVEVPLGSFTDMCTTDAGLEACLHRCEQRDPMACYAAAQQVQHLGSNDPLSEALFLRACALGISSGCTNRAAGMVLLEPERKDRLACAARTFEATCARHDPWGCTMFGRSLATGEGIARDPARALTVLPGGCSLGAEDEACKAATEVIRQVRTAGP